ncbi:MAG: hypothetical protein MUO76_18195, partial [Anaerolineaceae bacterium]|nr:hypothetical protein [Anaerolineaceae bacterium]
MYSREERTKRKKRTEALILAILGVLVLIIIVVLVYNVPAVKNRLEWRLDALMVYLRSVVNPIGSLPTPVAVIASITPTTDPTAVYSP